MLNNFCISPYFLDSSELNLIGMLIGMEICSGVKKRLPPLSLLIFWRVNELIDFEPSSSFLGVALAALSISNAEDFDEDISAIFFLKSSYWNLTSPADSPFPLLIAICSFSYELMRSILPSLSLISLIDS